MSKPQASRRESPDGRVEPSTPPRMIKDIDNFHDLSPQSNTTIVLVRAVAKLQPLFRPLSPPRLRLLKEDVRRLSGSMWSTTGPCVANNEQHSTERCNSSMASHSDIARPGRVRYAREPRELPVILGPGTDHPASRSRSQPEETAPR